MIMISPIALYINTERTQTNGRLILIEGEIQQRDWGQGQGSGGVGWGGVRWGEQEVERRQRVSER